MAEYLPDSWEVADLESSMTRLMLSKRDSSSASTSPPVEVPDVSARSRSTVGVVVTEDLVDSVDQFLQEAIRNPRERLSVLRLEQDVEKFVRDLTQQQMEFQQLPTSYLRLAAHRVAQHYSLQSMVLLDSALPDGSGSRIIIRKTSECRPPLIRLADIPVTLPTEDTTSSAVKVAIKQRPQKRSQNAKNAGSHSSKDNSSKSVEERKEDYNRARARIFSSSTCGGASGKPEIEARAQERFQHGSLGISKIEETTYPVRTDVNIGRGSVDSSAGSSRSNRSRIEKEPVGRYRTNNRVAIFRDREVERHDPDYDRSHDRYVQRFDPGFGFNTGSYPMQPLHSPVVNYNSEFPQLGAAYRSPLPAEHPSRLLPQHLPVPWVAASSPAGIGYGPMEAMMNPFSPNHNYVSPYSASTLYLNYPCQRPGMTFIHPLEQVHQPFPQQSHNQQQSDASFGLARPR